MVLSDSFFRFVQGFENHQFISYLTKAVQNLFDEDKQPLTTVLKVTSDDFESRPVIQQEKDGNMTLYGPKVYVDDDYKSSDDYYEIVLRKPFTEQMKFYSIFRSKEKELAKEKFAVFKEKIRRYFQVTKECKTDIVQKLCDVLSEHPTWSTAHLVVYIGCNKSFEGCLIQHHINEVDPVTCMTPVMVAVKENNLKMVQKLVSMDVNLDMTDCEGNSVFHYAASNEDMLKALTKIKSPSLNAWNKKGYTPFNLACKANDFNCIRVLLAAGADVNIKRGRKSENSCLLGLSEILQENYSELDQQDIKRGGTPLHWAKSRKLISALIEKNCDLNIINFNDRTALHIMVASGRLDCAIALASQGADVNIKDRDGNTPLHMAAMKSSVVMVQALIVFGADIEAVNNTGHTARHLVSMNMTKSNFYKMLYILHMVGAKRCAPEILGCTSGCSTNGDCNGTPTLPVSGKTDRDLLNYVLSAATKKRAAYKDSSEKHGRLLCLDGGGIKGLILVQILLSVEEAVGKPIVNCFDWIAGTSTGGILALALACGKTLRQCQGLYFKIKDLAFDGMRPYSSKILESVLQECLGPTNVMTDIKTPKLMILSLLADRKPVDLHIFRNYQSAEEILEEYAVTANEKGLHKEAGVIVSKAPLQPPPPPSQQLAWQAARSSGAAPSYFPAFGRYLDGGLIGNNPTLDALTELEELKIALQRTGQEEEAKKTDLKVVVSCGTGSIPVVKQKDIDIFFPGSILEFPRLTSTLHSILNILVEQASKSDGRIVERARSWCCSLGTPYYRLSPRLSKEYEMDEKKDEELVNMLWETMVYVRANHGSIEELAKLL